MRKSRIAAVLLFACVAQAHDLYLLPLTFRVQPGETFEFGIHNGDAFPVSEASPVLERLRDVNLYSAKMTAEARDLRIDGNRAVGVVTAPGEGDSSLPCARFPIHFPRAGQVSRIPEGRRTRPRDQVARGAGRIRESQAGNGIAKYAKSVPVAGASNGYYKNVLGLPLEIVPQEQAKVGASIPVLVLLRGKPAAGLQVEVASVAGAKVIGRTDGRGRIRVPSQLRAYGRVHVLHMERCADPSAADWERSLGQSDVRGPLNACAIA